jgi:hypothetical protein
VTTTKATTTKATTTKKSSTKTRSQKSKITTTCTTPALSTAQTKTETIQFNYDPNRQFVPKSGPNKGKSISGSNIAVITNMCRGIDKLNGGSGGNTVELTHGGKCFQEQNRPIMCEENGVSSCRDAINSYIKQFYPTNVPPWASAAIEAAGDLQCDEFPFASSVEGGNKATGVTFCVTSDDNGWQGGKMSSYFRKGLRKYIAEGEKYIVEITGWSCDKQQPVPRSRHSVELQPRDAFSGGGLTLTGRKCGPRNYPTYANDSTLAELFKSFDPDNPSANMMVMPLGDLSEGS